MGQRPQAIQDLVEEIHRVNLLHDLAVDSLADAQHPFAVNRLDGLGDYRGDAKEFSSITFVVRRSTPATAMAVHVRPRRLIGASSIVSPTWGC